MYTVILVARHDRDALRALLEESLGKEVSLVLFPSLAELYPAILKLDPLLVIIEGQSMEADEIGIIGTLKKTFSTLRILLTFRLAQRDEAAHALASGVDAYVLEPFYLDEFTQLVKREFKNAIEQNKQMLDLKMDALGSFVEGLAPEVNNPLTTIRGLLQLLLAGNNESMTDGEIDEIYGLMEKESSRISQIVQELENFSKTRKPKRLPVNLHTLIQQAVNEAEAASSKQTPIFADLEHCPADGMADFNQNVSALKSLLGFLLSGSDDKKGKIVLTARTSEIPGRISINIEGTHTVSLGQEVHQAFVPLYTRKIIRFSDELGLASAYGIIRGQGGTISVSSLDKGTRFEIEIPID